MVPLNCINILNEEDITLQRKIYLVTFSIIFSITEVIVVSCEQEIHSGSIEIDTSLNSVNTLIYNCKIMFNLNLH